jgi:lipopolysaccharide/colanic/teichoic acid biosynthesis glycosyltransferase
MRATIYLLDLVLLNAAYVLVNVLLRGSVVMEPAYLKLWALINGTWVAIVIAFGRTKVFKYEKLYHALVFLGRTAFYMLFLTTLILVIWNLSGFSRFHVIGTYLGFVALETLFLLPWRNYYIKSNGKRDSIQIRLKDIHLPIAITDFILFCIAAVSVYYLKRGTLMPTDTSVEIFIMLGWTWFLASTWTNKFIARDYNNIYFAYAPFFKSLVLMTAWISLIIFAFDLFSFSRMLVYGPVLVLAGLEIPLALVVMLLKVPTNNSDIESVDDVRKVLAQEELDMQAGRQIEVTTPVREKLEFLALTEFPHVFDFIDTSIVLNDIDAGATRVFNTHTPFNIEVLENHTLQLFVNLHQINDFRHMNEYFLTVHKKLVNGGFIVGRKSTIESRRDQIYKKYPRFMANAIYTADFMLRRVAPKIKGVSKVYFALTRGRARVLSRSELMGRLYFCGYKVVRTTEIDDYFYFIARKVMTPSLDRNPTYGPFIRLKRVGYQGKKIYIHKFRTMHPYAEYLQPVVYEQNKLHQNGKLKDDFRVTTWGKVLRKLWLDELPQLVNFVRGDVSIFGVRALSEHYFSLYPKDVQDLRIKTKPGLIPPFYADMPKSFDEIVESERRYLHKKLKHPFRTDFEYFFRAVYNIVFKGARSQ